MKKFLLRRIGMADKLANGPPSLHDCMEVVLSQADLLMGDVLEGLVILAARTKSKSAFREDLSISKEAVDFLFSQKHAVQKTFKSQLRNGIFNHAVQDFSEQPQLRFADLQLLDSQQIDANIEFAMAQQEVLRGVDEVLPALNALVSTLLGWITVQPHLNPIKPDVFVRALQASLVKHAPDEAARAALITPAAGLLRGTHIPLHQPADGAVGIGEGIETSLAACLASGLPTVAAYSAGNLAAWQWPTGARRLVIFGDHDKAGAEASDTLRARALAAGLRVQTLTPETPGRDWADVWSAREGAYA